MLGPDSSRTGDAKRAGPGALPRRWRGAVPRASHQSFKVLSEVPMPIVGDQRAWDLMLPGPTQSVGVEGETHLRDCQAIQRRILLKARDSSVERVILCLADTRANRAAVREAGVSLREMFPVPPRVAARTLARGARPRWMRSLAVMSWMR